MNQDGYTLVETLVALAAIGLAMGGLTAGVRVISLNQAASDRAFAADHALRGAQSAASSLLEGQGPYPSNDNKAFEGDDLGFHFECGDAAQCAVQLTAQGRGLDLLTEGPRGKSLLALPVRQAHWVYVGSKTVGPVWPPLAKDIQTLRSIVLVGVNGDAQAPIATLRIWKEQGQDCVFDAISGGCRQAGS